MFLRYPYVLRSPEGPGGDSSEPAKPAPASAPGVPPAPAVPPQPPAKGGSAPAPVPPVPPVPASAPVDKPAAPDGSQPPVPPVTDTPPTDPNKVTIGDKTYDMTKPEEAIAALEAKGKEFEAQRAVEQARVEQQTIQEKLDKSRAEWMKTNRVITTFSKQANTILDFLKESGRENAPTASEKELLDIFTDKGELGKEIHEALQWVHDFRFHQQQEIEYATVDSGEKFVEWAKLSGVPLETLYTENPADADPRSFKFWAVLEKQGLLKHTQEGKSYFTDPAKVETEFYKLFPKQGEMTLAKPLTNAAATASPTGNANQGGPAVTDEDRSAALNGKFSTLPPEKQEAVVQTFATEEFNRITVEKLAPRRFNDPSFNSKVENIVQRLLRERTKP